jgi:hypothetical protein
MYFFYLEKLLKETLTSQSQSHAIIKKPIEYIVPVAFHDREDNPLPCS